MRGRRNGRGKVGDRHPRSPTKPDQVSTLQCQGMAQQSDKMPQLGWHCPGSPGLGPQHIGSDASTSPAAPRLSQPLQPLILPKQTQAWSS